MPDFSDEAEVLVSAKIELRRSILARRRALSAEHRADAARRVRATLTDLVRRLRPARTAGYAPIGAEPGGAELPDVLHAALGGFGELLLPVLRLDLDLDWAVYRGPGTLRPAGRGMREPVGDRLGRTAVSDVRLVVVPALAVDLAGNRLGRGGGSYDRALARLGPGTAVVALLHDGELVDRLPAQPHDRPVTASITPTGGLGWLIPGPSANGGA